MTRLGAALTLEHHLRETLTAPKDAYEQSDSLNRVALPPGQGYSCLPYEAVICSPFFLFVWASLRTPTLFPLCFLFYSIPIHSQNTNRTHGTHRPHRTQRTLRAQRTPGQEWVAGHVGAVESAKLTSDAVRYGSVRFRGIRETCGRRPALSGRGRFRFTDNRWLRESRTHNKKIHYGITLACAATLPEGGGAAGGAPARTGV